MRTCLMFLILLSVSFASLKANEKYTYSISVYSTDGSKACYMLTEKIKLLFKNDDFIISANDINLAYPIKEVASFVYEKEAHTSIDNATKRDDVSFYLGKDLLTITQLTPHTKVYLYKIDGTCIFETLAKDGTCTIPISNLSKGIYIVKSKDFTTKITTK